MSAGETKEILLLSEVNIRTVHIFIFILSYWILVKVYVISEEALCGRARSELSK